MAQVSGETLLNELDEFVSAASAESSADEAATPFEAFEDYSTNPVSFCDMSKFMLGKVDDVFDLAVKYNRRSSQYLKAVGKLEQGIKYLASCCVTKTAMKENSYDVSAIGQLSTEKLYRMASYHFRKIDRGLTEYIEENKGEIDFDLLDMEYRYFNLLNRLRATEVKVYRYNLSHSFGEEKSDSLLRGNAFTKQSCNNYFNEQNTEPAAFRQARAFSALESSNFKVQSSDLKCSECRVQSSDLQCSECRVQSSDLEGSNFNVQSSDNDGTVALSVLEQGSGSKEQTVKSSDLESSKSKVQSTNLDGADALSDLEQGTRIQDSGTGDPEDDGGMVDVPGYFNILQRAMLRSPIDPEHPDERSFTFTVEEMEELAVDPQFANDYPEMAVQIQSELARYNNDPPRT